MKRKELFWMLIPCLIFIAVALYFSRREEQKQQSLPQPTPVPTGPFALTIREIREVPVNADEVADGYDTKVRFLLGCTGKPPANWGKDGFGTLFSDPRVLVKKDGKWIRLFDNIGKEYKNHGIGTSMNLFQKDKNAYLMFHLMRLHDIPPSFGDLNFKFDWYYQFGQSTLSGVGPQSFAFLRKSRAPQATAELVVRQKGEIIKAPQVSHDPQIQLKKVVVRPLTKNEKFEYSGCDTKVEFHVFYSGPLQRDDTYSPTRIAGSIYVQDEKGEKYYFNHVITTESDDRATARRQIVPLYLDVKQVPLRKGKVTVHTQVQVGNNWPLDVQTIVRPLPKNPKP